MKFFRENKIRIIIVGVIICTAIAIRFFNQEKSEVEKGIYDSRYNNAGEK